MSSAVKNVTSKRFVVDEIDSLKYRQRRNLPSPLFVADFSFKMQLNDMKCSIDNKRPRIASHLKTQAKKNALMQERFAQIETENRLLLERMSHIMRVSVPSFVMPLELAVTLSL